jgi:hypothetical protein
VSTAITIINSLPAELVALSAEAAGNLAQLAVDAAAVVSIDTLPQYQAADLILGRCTLMAREIEAERKRLKAPILDLGRALDDAAGEVLAPLLGIKADLGRRVLAYQTAENARRAEEARRVAEERAAAAAEARLQQIEADRIRKEAEAAALQASMADAPDLAPWEEPVAEIVVPERITIVPEYVAPAPPPLKSLAVKRSTVRRLVVDDEDLIPDAVSGVALWTRDDAAIKRLMTAGVDVPGCRLVSDDIVAAK